MFGFVMVANGEQILRESIGGLPISELEKQGEQ